MLFSNRRSLARNTAQRRQIARFKPLVEALEDRLALSTVPVVDLTGPSVGVPGLTLAYSGSFTDPDGQTYDESWLITDGVDTIASGDEANFTFTPTAVGTYFITFSVNDGVDGTGTDTITLTVQNAAVVDNVLHVVGTDGNDTIVINPQGKQGTSNTTVGVKLSGVSLGKFSGVNSIVVSGLAGNDNIQIAGGIKVSTELHGGDDNDRLKGGAGRNLLLGEDGDDYLIGGRNSDLLIGGDGIDRIVGGPGDDILIAGTTAYDLDSDALRAILEAWNSSNKLSDRVAALRTGTVYLQATDPNATVLDDDDADKLTGAAGTDWFFADPLIDKITGKTSKEVANDDAVPA